MLSVLRLQLKAKKVISGTVCNWANVTSSYIHEPSWQGLLCAHSTFRIIHLWLKDCSWCLVLKKKPSSWKSRMWSRNSKLALDLHYLSTTAGFGAPELAADLLRNILHTFCTSSQLHIITHLSWAPQNSSARTAWVSHPICLAWIGLHRVLSSACCSFNHDTAQQQLFGGAKQLKECVLGSSMLGEKRVIDSCELHSSESWLRVGWVRLRNSQPDCHTSHKLTKFLITFSSLRLAFGLKIWPQTQDLSVYCTSKC